MVLISHFTHAILSSGMVLDGLEEIQTMADACPFREGRDIAAVTLEQLIEWRKV